MKPFKTIYLTLYKNDIIFPKSIQYIGDDYYLCSGPKNNKFVVPSIFVFKLSEEEFDELIKKIHSTMYSSNSEYNLFNIKDIDGDFVNTMCIYPNGHIDCGGFSCTLYVPRNCMLWGRALLKGYDNDSYILLPCNKNGKIIESKKREVNPYTNNCNIVYDVISKNPGISTSELIDLLGWPPNSVTSRISELVSGSRIYSIGRVTNPKSGRKVHKWMTMEDVEGNSYVL